MSTSLDLPIAPRLEQGRTSADAPGGGGHGWNWIAAALAAIFFALLLPQIGSGVLWQHDELLAGNRTREMLVRGNPWTVTYDFAPDFKKPPLDYWCCALLWRAFPARAELAIRLPSLICGALCLFAVALLARAAYPQDPPSSGVWAALALAVSGFFVHSSRVGLLDSGAALFLTVTVLGCQLARRDARWWWLTGAACVLGAWQKEPYGFGAWLVILVVRRRRGETIAASSRAPFHLSGAWTVSLLIAASWWIGQGFAHGFGAVAAARLNQAQLLTNSHDPGDAGFRPYLYWFWLMRDWAAIGFCAPVAVLLALRNQPKSGLAGGRSEPNAEIGWVCALYGLSLAIVPFRAERYLVAIAPLLALLTARFLRDLPALLPRRLQIPTMRWLLAAAILSALPVAVCTAVIAHSRMPDLFAAARTLGRDLRPGETPIIDAGADPNFEVASFVAFYADLRRPWQELPPAAIAAFPGPILGLCRASQWPALQSACPSARIDETYGEWIIWMR